MAKAKADIRSLARSHTETCIRVLAGIVGESKAPHAARVAAAQALLDRGWGKPEVHVEIDETKRWIITDETMNEENWTTVHSLATPTGTAESSH